MAKEIRTVVVTGGAGFIGSHLCEFLLNKGHQVICIDNFLTGKKDNLASFKDNPNFTFIEHNVTEHIELDQDIDAVMHLASPASPVDYQKLPIQTLKVGSLGTHNMLGLAKDKQATFVLASTSEVYGDPEVNPQPETYWGNVNPIGIRGCYDEAKRFAESLTMAYRRVHNVDTKIIRIFNTYGPRMRLDDGRVIPNLITQALKNEPLTVYGKGNQTRSFCFVTDLVEGIYRIMNSDAHLPLNLGNPEEHTILELAELIITATNSTSKIAFKPLPQDDPHLRCPDITQVKTKLGWQPTISITEGLAPTIEFFKNALQ